MAGFSLPRFTFPLTLVSSTHTLTHTMQCKRIAHTKSREAEAANAAADEARQNFASKPITEKEIAKVRGGEADA